MTVTDNDTETQLPLNSTETSNKNQVSSSGRNSSDFSENNESSTSSSNSSDKRITDALSRLKLNIASTKVNPEPHHSQLYPSPSTSLSTLHVLPHLEPSIPFCNDPIQTSIPLDADRLLHQRNLHRHLLVPGPSKYSMPDHIDEEDEDEGEDDDEEEEDEEEDDNDKDADGSLPSITFPTSALAVLNEQINMPRWVIPVLPKAELEILLRASIIFSKKGIALQNEHCVSFFKYGLSISFNRLLNDDAVTAWKLEIHRCILRNCELLIHLCVLQLPNDVQPILDLLALVFNPNNKFYTVEANRKACTSPHCPTEMDIYAQFNDLLLARKWLIQLINLFGRFGGFDLLANRILGNRPMNISLLASLLKPFSLCHEYLSTYTIQKYFVPIIAYAIQFVEQLSDANFRKESKNENKTDSLAGLLRSLKTLVGQTENHEENLKRLEYLRLKIILRLLQVSPFNGKMSALNEIHKVINSITSLPTRSMTGSSSHIFSSTQEDHLFTPAAVAAWFKENHVLEIVLKDSLHQPQYVEKLDKIIRFLIKEQVLTFTDLDDLWAAQCGKHEAIVKNMHDLLAKLAWDFSPEQLDHLFVCFQNSWTNASKKQREKLLELMRRLAEEDKEGVMANKVLNLLWSFAHNDVIPTDIMDQALAAHVKILDYSGSQNRNTLKNDWLVTCVKQLENSNQPDWVLPALKQIREICVLYPECNYTPGLTLQLNDFEMKSTKSLTFRGTIVHRLQAEHDLITVVTDSLESYMERARTLKAIMPDMKAGELYQSSRYSHVQQVQERLNFLQFVFKEGQIWISEKHAKQIWTCLVERSVFNEDREANFNWFTQLMSTEPDFTMIGNFFADKVLHLDPQLMTESGIKCFDKFFKIVNSKDEKDAVEKQKVLADGNYELIGLEYIWAVILNANDSVSALAIELLKETYSNLSNWMQDQQLIVHRAFIHSCVTRLQSSYVLIMDHFADAIKSNVIKIELIKMTRVLRLLFEYVMQCDTDYAEERVYLPMQISSIGKRVTLLIRVANNNRPIEDFELVTHTNESLTSIRNRILATLKSCMNSPLSQMMIDLQQNGEFVYSDAHRDNKLVQHLLNNGKLELMVKLYHNSGDKSQVYPSVDLIGGNLEAEECLPGVFMSKDAKYSQFFFKVADLGIELQHESLYLNALRILRAMPIDSNIMNALSTNMFETVSNLATDESLTRFRYTLEALCSLLFPAKKISNDTSFDFQCDFILNGSALKVLQFITQKSAFSTFDHLSKVCTFLVVLKISKFVYNTVSIYNEIYQFFQTYLSADKSCCSNDLLNEIIYRNKNDVTCEMAQSTVTSIIKRESQIGWFNESVKKCIPTPECFRTVLRFIWCTATGQEQMSTEPGQGHYPLIASKNGGIMTACVDSLAILYHMFNLKPEQLEQLSKEGIWNRFTIDLILLCPEKAVREAALHQFSQILSNCNISMPFRYSCVESMFDHLKQLVPLHFEKSDEFFALFCKLLQNSEFRTQSTFLHEFVEHEISVLGNVRCTLAINGLIEETQLRGHLCILRQLVLLLPSERRAKIAQNRITSSRNFVEMLIFDFIFPFSRSIALQKRRRSSMDRTEIGFYDRRGINSFLYNQTNESVSPSNGLQSSLANSSANCRSDENLDELNADDADVNAVCTTSATLTAVYDLIIALCLDCVINLKFVCDTLNELLYQEAEYPSNVCDFLHSVGPRPTKGFVGLKNAGATCYMNSVLQQLYMIPEIREGILAVEGAANDPAEDFNGEVLDTGKAQSRRDYNIGVLKHVQAIFGHLALGRLQFYVPGGFWRHFKLFGEPINLREQHDALEFYNSLVDSLDEALKSLNLKPLMTETLGGTFADQKICLGCPHRYSREESFTTLNIDIRNHNNLLESLEQYVKGDLLEGANAYHCDKCNRKVDTIKRLCIEKLPRILAIQLKRFDYDWERETAIKFNDYFEFPPTLDMHPYTAEGLAEAENDANESLDRSVSSDTSHELNSDRNTEFELSGIVVHSGLASGGHYYSYISVPPGSSVSDDHIDEHLQSSANRWHKFDDGDVSDSQLHLPQEMRAQCFGGDYSPDTFESGPIIGPKRTVRKQRWWSAYILFYRRKDALHHSSAGNYASLELLPFLPKEKQPKMPTAIRRSVQMQNSRYLHIAGQFSTEYFNFVRQLTEQTTDLLNQENGSQLAQHCVQLLSRFLFGGGWKVRKSIRGCAIDWAEIFACHLKASPLARRWLTQLLLQQKPNLIADYLIDCSSADVRQAFAQLLALLAQLLLKEQPPQDFFKEKHKLSLNNSLQLSNRLLKHLMGLLRRLLTDNNRSFVQLVVLFNDYALCGPDERAQLIHIELPVTLLSVIILDDIYPGKQMQNEVTRLYQLLFLLLRSCDLTPYCKRVDGNIVEHNNPLSLPIQGVGLAPLDSQLVNIFSRNVLVKRLVEECCGPAADTCIKIICLLSWENFKFSLRIIIEIIWHLNFMYENEHFKAQLNLLRAMLLLHDSWNQIRLHRTLTGIQVNDDKNGLFEYITQNRNQHPRQVYQCIECLTEVMSNNSKAAQLLRSDAEFHEQWSTIVSYVVDQQEQNNESANQRNNVFPRIYDREMRLFLTPDVTPSTSHQPSECALIGKTISNNGNDVSNTSTKIVSLDDMTTQTIATTANPAGDVTTTTTKEAPESVLSGNENNERLAHSGSSSFGSMSPIPVPWEVEPEMISSLIDGFLAETCSSEEEVVSSSQNVPAGPSNPSPSASDLI